MKVIGKHRDLVSQAFNDFPILEELASKVTISVEVALDRPRVTTAGEIRLDFVHLSEMHKGWNTKRWSVAYLHNSDTIFEPLSAAQEDNVREYLQEWSKTQTRSILQV